MQRPKATKEKGLVFQMKMFQEHNSRQSQAHKDIYAAYELAYTLVDFSAALLFVVGSVMFFYDSWQIPGTWCFLIGSIFFGVKPTLRVVREFHYLAIGRKKHLAERAPN
ncbi:YrhK-like protein [Cohaesibacter marisflavi]|uniref:YrhK-like protein n=2 Tax=Cohaesibacter marisflavi TaxID=655353 RepID=A0A1I5FYX1_9HYPH|nr:YrhK-like protein [Cohaesibacter marisflavi]